VGESTLATAGPEGSAVGLEVSVVECGAPTTAPRAPAGLPFAVEEHRLEVVQLDLFEASPHLLVLGDAGCGKSSLLRLVANGLAARHPPDEVALVIVDPRRGLLDLTALPNLVGYAYSTTTVTQAVDQLQREFEERSAGFELLPVPSMPALAPRRGRAFGPRWAQCQPRARPSAEPARAADGAPPCRAGGRLRSPAGGRRESTPAAAGSARVGA
jgi:hypothetical protein